MARLRFHFAALLCAVVVAVNPELQAATNASESAHRLKPGDVLDIKVYEHPELALRTRVDADGTIRFPLCGSVKVSEQTANSVAVLMSEKLQAANIPDAQVFVYVAEYVPRYIYVLGAVNGLASKAQVIPPEGRVSALQAISTAGGFTNEADLRNVFVIRNLANGERQRIPVDARGLMTGAKDAKDLLLHPGDTVVVPAAKPVTVLGKVGHAGAYHIDTANPLTTVEMISRAGGFTAAADLRNVTVTRQAADGTQQVIPIDVQAVLKRRTDKSDVHLQPGDNIVVPTASPVSVLGVVAQPGSFQIDTGAVVSVAEMISRAGGFLDGADQDQTLLLRSVGGKPVTATIPLGQFARGEVATNPLVQPGDIVIAAPRDKVFVLGQVRSAGAFDVPPEIEMTVTRAIALAGGFGELASERAILLIRGTDVERVDLRKALRQDGDISSDRVLEPGDIVFVTESRW